jgi:hypothetical protein
MNNLNLTTTTQGVRGGKNKNIDCGYSLLTVRKNGSEGAQISIDTFEGSGASYKERETPHIEIYFAGFEMWKGTPEDLKTILAVKKLI